MDKIKDCQPCPFCGTPNDIELSNVDIQDREGFPVAMSCATCGCVGPWDYCPVPDENYWLATAVYKWNQQAALNDNAQLRQERDALKKRVEELERMIAHFVNVRDSIEVWKKSPEMFAEEYLAQSEHELESVIAAMEAATTPGGDK